MDPFEVYRSAVMVIHGAGAKGTSADSRYDYHQKLVESPTLIQIERHFSKKSASRWELALRVKYSLLQHR